VLSGPWIAVIAVVIVLALAWLWRWLWAAERAGEATPYARRRALIGFTVLVIFVVVRNVAIWGWP